MDPLLLPLEGFPGFWKNLEEKRIEPLFLFADELEEEYDWVDKAVGRVLSPRTAQAFYSFDNVEHKLQAIVSATGICLDFDWKAWQKEISRYENSSLVELKERDPLTLCQIITVFVQKSKAGCFGEVGYLLENKFLYNVLRAVQHQYLLRSCLQSSEL